MRLGKQRSLCDSERAMTHALRSQVRQVDAGKPAPLRAQIAQRWGVARETTAHAHRWLAERGYLVAVADVGMVVTLKDRWSDTPKASD